ncbi:MAG: methyltransferase domain-containing protein [Planctomycetota bacterium]
MIYCIIVIMSYNAVTIGRYIGSVGRMPMRKSMVSHQDPSETQRAIREKYRQVACSAEGLFKYPTGPEGARALKYDDEMIGRTFPELLRSFCGVGNPFTLGAIAEGEVVLDIGCGAGFDLFIAGMKVGPAGKAIGIDITPEMVALATENIARYSMKNIKVLPGASESLPFHDSSFDLIISNGVLNLSPEKERTFAEAFRVLKRKGRLQFADIILNQDLPQEIVGNPDAWSS